MKTQAVSICRFSYCLLLCLQQVQAAEIAKLANNNALNLGAAWNGNAVPGVSDIALWDSTGPFPNTVANQPIMGGDLSFQGIKVTNVGGGINTATSTVGYQNASSANTLTIGAGGIDMSAATQALHLEGKISITANQTWTIANANTVGNPQGFNNNEDLGFQARAANIAFNLGGNTVTTAGLGQITASSGYAFSNGTLNVGNNLFVIQGGSNTVTSVANTLTINITAGTLRFQNNSGAVSSAAPVTVGTGTLEILVNNANTNTHTGAITLNTGSILGFTYGQNGTSTLGGPISVAGNTTLRSSGAGMTTNFSTISGNISGAGNINYLNTATAANGFVRLTGDNSGYTGTLSLAGTTNNRILRLSSATAGSAAATWNVGAGNTLQIDGVTAQLGTIAGTGTITNGSTTAPATATVRAGQFPGTIIDGAPQPIGLTKAGPGNLVLSGANTYTGATVVSEGTLLTTPLQTGAGAVSVADAATFGVNISTVNTSFSASTLTLGGTAGGTLQLDFGSLANPTIPPVAVTDLVVNGASVIRLVGKNLTTGTFPILQYTNPISGGTGFGGLTLALPTRTTGSITDTGTGINVTISATQQAKWNGDVSNDWDADPDGLGVIGTPNWITTVTAASTRYLQGSAGTDVVTFDDSATGSGTVNLTTTLSPLALTVNNTTKDYSFVGSGKISGFTGLEKLGTGVLTLANTTANDYSGGTVITAGSLKLGDGVTAGAGVVAGNINIGGTLVLNRPDDSVFSNPLSGTGTLEKAQTSVVSVSTSPVLNGPVALSGGRLKFIAGGTLNGVVSGSAELEAAGGTVVLQGADANTQTGLTTVSAGTLQLNKPLGVNAVAGDITITGTGNLAVIGGEQIPDTATLNVLGSSTDSMFGSNVMETFANANLTGSGFGVELVNPTTQLILRAGQTITGTATVNHGILGVGSGQTGTVGTILLNTPTAWIRVAGGSAASTLNVGSGGIIANGGQIQVKFNTNNQDAIINLSGDLNTTGNLAITNAGYNGPNANQIRLNGSRTFSIGDATTTTVAPDIGDFINPELVVVPGTLVKSGTGTLTLGPLCSATHTGGTTVDAGSLQVNGQLAGTVQVNASGILGGTGTLSGAATIAGALAPGQTVGQLNSTSTLTLGPDSDYVLEVGSWTGITPGTHWDHLAVDTLALTATPANKLTLRVAGTPDGFTEVGKTLVIATSVQPITGFDASAIQIDSTGFSGGGTWAVQQTGNTLEAVYTAAPDTPFDTWASGKGLDETNNGPAQDPDGDSQSNLTEFALDGEPLSGAASGKVVGKIATVGADQALTLTLPVRSGAVFAGSTEQTATVDGVVYRIQGGNNLGSWALAVSEVTDGDATTIQNGLPALSTGWTYRTFRTPGPVSTDPREFIRAVIDPAP
jgi:autotransporter-associated beta strand protein